MRDAKVDLEACEKATRGPWFVDDGEGDIFGIFADIDLGANGLGIYGGSCVKEKE